ncbi:MAG: TetR/AcrR family transcriptional regulator [Proteobacteria bacterium]|nr:MAG: TetR/AcrR family transcriptional regulator [Pseudomonadota bacterium]
MKPKSFDPEKTLQVIAEAFAHGGYEGTSMEDLTKRTGLGKQSLYNAFGDKRAMMEKSLGCAGKQTESAKCFRQLEGNARQKIELFFEKLITELGDAKKPGCLVTNLLLEKGACDKEVAKLAGARWEQTRALMACTLEEGKKDKSLPVSLDVEAVSFALMNLLNGLRVTARAINQEDKLKKIVRLSLDAWL